jgi:hypothetical protein
MTRRPRILYSEAEMQWLESNRMMVISDYHAAFVAAFGRSDVTAPHLHGLRKRKVWKVGRDPGRYVGRNLQYTEAEMEWLRANCTMEIKEYHRAYCEQFKCDDVTASALHSLRKRFSLKTGRTGRFDKGAVPWSKGKKIGNNPGSARTQFRTGKDPHNFKGAGHESLGDDGYFWIVTDRTNPWTGASTWRVHKHRFLWKQQHGPVPEGMVLKSKDGNRLNAEPSNWEPVPIGILPRLNGKSGRGYDVAPAELKPTIMAVAKLEHRLRAKA